MDGIGFHILAMALSLGWFVFLWGVRMSSLAAGLALYALFLLARRKTRDSRLKRKESRLREKLGGELAIERLLIASPARAHFETAMLLSLRYPMTLVRTGDTGVLCEAEGKKALISFLQSPPGEAAGPGDVLKAQRDAAAAGADLALLCTPGSIGEKARQQADRPVPVSFLDREALIRLFGAANPATDAQLAALGKRRRASAILHRPGVLSPRRAKRYACYGVMLLIMYQFSPMLWYALPGLVCVGLAAASRCYRPRRSLFGSER